MIGVIDYGLGNLRSVEKALEYVGWAARLTRRGEEFAQFAGLVLPGVGAFGQGMDNLEAGGLVQLIRNWVQAGKPLLGICLGMQLLFQSSEEDPGVEGLSLFPGKVARFDQELKVPQVGWNRLKKEKTHPLFEGIEEGSFAYFVHSYYVVPRDRETIIVTSDYGVNFPAAVGRGRCIGVQFHPEKSSDPGLQILKNFGGMCYESNTCH